MASTTSSSSDDVRPRSDEEQQSEDSADNLVPLQQTFSAAIAASNFTRTVVQHEDDEERRRSSTQSTSTRRTSRITQMPSIISAQSRVRQISRTSSYTSERTLSSASAADEKSSDGIFGEGERLMPSTMKVFTDYGNVIANRDMDPESKENRRKRDEENYHRSVEAKYNEIHQRLLDSEFWESHHALEKFAAVFSNSPKKVERPSKEELLGLVKHCYPPRCSVKVIVYDVFPDHAKTSYVEVAKIQTCMQEKPTGAILRWIHAPFGLGIPHSTIEELFCYSGPQGPAQFENAGKQGFPFLEINSLHFRSKRHFQQMRDVFVLLSKDKELTAQLDKLTFVGDENNDLQSDMEWRANFVNSSLDFWSLCQSDLPGQLSENAMNPDRRLTKDRVLGGPVRGFKEVEQDAQAQALSAHPFFKDCVLVSSPFRAFHSPDGFLLTMSPTRGVDYMDRDLAEFANKPQECLLKNESASVIAHIMKKFEKEGAKFWHRRTSEWFAVFLITEIGSQPTNNMGGCTAPTLHAAYESVVADLKRRRYHPWRRDQNIDLVHEFNNCMDELNILITIYSKKITVFKGLVEDCRRLEAKHRKNRELPNDVPDAELAIDRAKWALKVAQENYDGAKILLADLTQSLEALFQIRSIEQNERAIIADKLNKAVFVFTAVTIVFLPLSFFSSYYGMNLATIKNTTHDQKFFWSVCGTISLIIVLFTLGYAHKTGYSISLPGWQRAKRRKALALKARATMGVV